MAEKISVRVDDLEIALRTLKFVIDMESADFNVGREVLAYERMRGLVSPG
jgi:hypothetical protein